MFDYESLRLIWWLLLGVLLIGFAVTDGFDFGVAALLHLVAKTDTERRVAINAIAPTWEGNQVWFILGGGAIFAAWPTLYAVSFSCFYLAMFAALLAFIIRPVGFKYRSKLDNVRWRATWDIALVISGIVPPLIFGVAIGNVLQGIPFYFDPTLRSFYTGSFFGLLNPFALVCGLVSLFMLVMHGGFYLATKTEGQVAVRAAFWAKLCAALVIILFLIAGLWIAYGIEGYKVISAIAHEGPSNPLYKTVTRAIGAWINNYKLYPWMKAAPILAFAAALLAIVLSHLKFNKLAFVASGLTIASIIATVGLSMFPFLLPSSTNPSTSLLVWDASSSKITLAIMLFCAAVFLPLILAYTTWVYRIMRGKVSAEVIKQDEKNYY